MFHQLSTRENLSSQLFNYYVYKDLTGFIWISSINGLNRFDGRTVKQYQTNSLDSFSIADPNVTSNFFEDSNRNLWFTTANSINKYDRVNDRFDHVKLDSNNIHSTSQYYLLYFDSLDNLLWFRANNNLFVFDYNESTSLKLTGEFELNIFSQIVPDASSTDLLLFTAPSGLGIQLNRLSENLTVGRNQKFLPEIHANCLFYWNNNNCWIGSDNGLVHLDLSSGDYFRYEIPSDGVKGKITDIKALNDSILVIATPSRGIYLFNRESKIFEKRIDNQFNGIKQEFPYQIDKIYVDRDQTLWVSTAGHGLYYTNLEKSKFLSQLKKSQYKTSQQSIVRSISEDSNKRLWCLTMSGIAILDSSGIINSELTNFYRKQIPFLGEHVYSIFIDSWDQVWVAAQSGLYALTDPAKGFNYISCFKNDSLINQAFLHIYQLMDSTILASSQDGIFRVTKERDLYIGERIEISERANGVFTWIYQNPNNRKVLFRKMEDSFQIYNYDNNKFQIDTIIKFRPWVNYIVADDFESTLRITTTEGLYNFRIDRIKSKIKQDSMLNLESMNGLLIDSHTGDLWYSNNNGLHKFDKGIGQIRSYMLSDGLQNNEFDLWSVLKTSTGRFIFGGVNGLNLFMPEEVKDIETYANPIITDIIINDEKSDKSLRCTETGATNISEIQRIVQNFNNNTISFRFSALEYSDPDATQFKYMMSGIDKDWTAPNTDNFTRYPNLAPGNYDFKLMASNSDGIWSPTVRSLSITISPPWYLTWWFKSLSSILVLLIVFGVHKNRIGKIKNAELFKRQEAELKQKEAEYKQLAAETQTAILRLQMNPHFIFNSMNSISSFILNKEVQTANEYLVSFSNLMRTILELAARPFVTLYQEIDLLRQYLNIESRRLSHPLTFSFSIDDALDKDNILVPTMILQPFVENAIWHGIAQSKQPGNINIEIFAEGNHLICNVKDNGIGREAAIDTIQSMYDHKSMSLSITKKRLKLLEEEYKVPTQLIITDLYDDFGNSTGTSVSLHIPLI